MEYIYDRIIHPLNDYLYEDRELEWWQWKDMKEDAVVIAIQEATEGLHV